MTAPIDLPPGLPDSLTHAELREAVKAFGFRLMLLPLPAPPQPPGFALPREGDRP